ncbi:hypothetical protein Ddye_031290 [Dipteronia dyeriana]|uniref:glucan endo-1,3-beta-D-glucosidase n=1 Tax=Dipteronia dyeriana TaxID=168575 RepID=A0AAD9WNJ3_9ROSI|nr:hypothetical protein Ddye_031290 [Dipteronia dyeriana]
MLIFAILAFLLPSPTVAAPVGVCYGRLANNLPPPADVINLLQSNGISNVRIFNPDPSTLQSFSGSGIKLMIGVPNEFLPYIATGNPTLSLQWLQSNIFSHIPPNQIRYIAVGNEILLQEPYYTPYVVPAMLNLYQALQILNLADFIKLSSPQAASVLSASYPPSSGTFDPYIKSAMLPLLQFLHDSKSPFMVNIYPYLSYTRNPMYISLDYTLFRSQNAVPDGASRYSNLFDASIDAFVYAMEKEGFVDIPVVVTETGWPTSGGVAASIENAVAYNGNVARRAASGVGTPKRPGGEGVEMYLFDLFDENSKGGEEYEKHFGIFGVDGFKLYDISFN